MCYNKVVTLFEFEVCGSKVFSIVFPPFFFFFFYQPGVALFF